MEAQLAAYRAKKQRELQSQQSLLSRIFNRRSTTSEKKDQEDTVQQKSDLQTNDTSDTDVSPERSTSSHRRKTSVDTSAGVTEPLLSQENSAYSNNVYYVILFLKVLLWFILWGFFIELQFGAVYFIVSLSILMYFNTGTGSRSNRLSAYSVFNQNQERIDGTFTSEQFEKELRFGAGSVR